LEDRAVKAFPKGKTQYGTFVDWIIEGQGQETCPDAAEYDHKAYSGNYKKGLFQGNGKMKMFDNSLYKGNFDQGKKEGKGTFTFTDDNNVAWKYIG